MKTTIYKPYYDYEKEEKWLNEMSAKGLALIDYSFYRYVFEDCKPGEYVYRIELLEHVPSHPESRTYIEFLEQSGVEHIASYVRWVYFRQKTENEPFDLYTDIDSRIKHYGRINTLWFTLACAELMIAISQIAMAIGGTGFSFSYISGGLLLSPAVLFFLLSCATRKRIKRLKKERDIRE